MDNSRLSVDNTPMSVAPPPLSPALLLLRGVMTERTLLPSLTFSRGGDSKGSQPFLILLQGIRCSDRSVPENTFQLINGCPRQRPRLGTICRQGDGQQLPGRLLIQVLAWQNWETRWTHTPLG